MAAVEIDIEPVSDWIAATVDGVELPLAFHRVGHGQSNPTFLVEDASGRRLVLRRPPTGPLLPSAHDVGREFKIISALHRTDIPVPVPRGLCSDESVTGAPFYLMDFCEGHILANRDAGEPLSEDVRRNAGESLMRTLAALHAVDVDAIGLSDLGRHGGYAARQVKRWTKQWEGSKTEEVPAIEELARVLGENMPEQVGVSIVHGDYRLDNAIVDDAGEIAAILDWELCTLGDPLADLGLLMVYWAEPGEDAPLGRSPATTLPGFPSRAEATRIYAEASGRDLSALGYFRTLGYWKLAVIVQGVYARALNNPDNTGPGAIEYGRLVGRLAGAGIDSARDAGLL